MARSISGGYRPNPSEIDQDGKRCLGGSRAQRLLDAEAGECRRSTVAGHAPDVGECLFEAAPELVDRGAIVVRCSSLGQQPKLDADADEALLGAVVQIALDATALEVPGVEGADTGLPEVALQADGPDERPGHAAEHQADKQDHRRSGCLQDGHSEEHAERDRDAQEHHSCHARWVPLRRASGVHRSALRAPSSCSFAPPADSPCGSARPSRCRSPRDTRSGVLRGPRFAVITRIGNHPGDSRRARAIRSSRPHARGSARRIACSHRACGRSRGRANGPY